MLTFILTLFTIGCIYGSVTDITLPWATVTIGADIHGEYMHVTCLAIMDSDVAEPRTITLSHIKTELRVEATNALTEDEDTCTDSIVYTDLMSEEISEREGGMSEFARKAEGRYKRGTRCIYYPDHMGRNRMFELDVIVRPITHYDRYEWKCDVISQNIYNQLETRTDSDIGQPVTVNERSSILSEGGVPEIIVSVHPYIAGTYSDPGYHENIAVGCSLPGYVNPIEENTYVTSQSYMYITMAYEQEDSVGIDIPMGRVFSTAEIYGRNVVEGEYDTYHDINNIHYPYPDVMCYDVPSFIHPTSHKSDLYNLDDETILRLTPPRVKKSYKTMCFDNRVLRSYKTKNDLFYLNNIVSPFDSPETGTDFILVADKEKGIGFLPENRQQEGRLNDYSLLYDGSLFNILHDNCPGTVDDGCNNPENHLVLARFDLTKTYAAGDGHGIEGMQRIVMKLPEQEKIEAFRLLHDKPYVNLNGIDNTPLPQFPVYFLPTGPIVKDWYRKIGVLLRDYEQVEIRQISSSVPNHQNHIRQLECGTDLIGNGRVFDVQYVILMNNACEVHNPQLPSLQHTYWCNKYGQDDTGTELGIWHVKEYNVDTTHSTYISSRINPRSNDKNTGYMHCMWRVYACGYKHRERKNTPMNKEVIIIDPEVPYMENYTSSKGMDKEIVVTDTECVYGGYNEEAIENVFENSQHGLIKNPISDAKKMWRNYDSLRFFAEEMVAFMIIGLSNRPSRRISYESYKQSWGTQAQPKYPCYAVPSVCGHYEDIFDFGGFIPNLVAYSTTNIVDFYTKTVVQNPGALMWCEFDGVRSPKLHPRELVESYLFPYHLSRIEGAPIAKIHENWLRIPEIHVIRGIGLYVSYTNILGIHIPWAASIQDGSIATILLSVIDEEEYLIIRRTFSVSNNLITYTKRTIGLEDTGEIVITPDAHNRVGIDDIIIIFPDEEYNNKRKEEQNINMWIKTDILLQYDTISVSYGAESTTVTSGPKNVKELVEDAEKKCMENNYKFNISIPDIRMISCDVYVENNGHNTSCNEPIVHLYSYTNTDSGEMIRQPYSVICSEDKNSESFLLEQQQYHSVPFSAGDTYCIHAEDKKKVTAVITIPEGPGTSDDSTIWDEIHYRCSFKEDINDITGYIDTNINNTNTNCIPPPSYFEPDIKDVSEEEDIYQTTVINCYIPEFIRSSICHDQIIGMHVYLFYDNSLRIAGVTKKVASVHLGHNMCNTNDETAIRCNLTKDSEKEYLQVKIGDSVFFDMIDRVYVGSRLRATCRLLETIDISDKYTNIIPLSYTEDRIYRVINAHNYREEQVIDEDEKDFIDRLNYGKSSQSNDVVISLMVVSGFLLGVVITFCIYMVLKYHHLMTIIRTYTSINHVV